MEHKTLVKTQREIFLTYWKKLASIFLALVILLSIFGGALDVWALEQAENKPPPKQFINGIIPEELDLGYPQPKMNRTAMPAYWDSREYGWISSVKNQGQNGLCWAFAMYGAVEANMLKNGLGEQDFSELHKAYATSNRSGNNLQGFDREPGDGGNRSYSTAYFMRGTTLSGTVAESQDPYNSNLLPLRNLSITQSKTKNYTVENVLFLSDDTKNESINGVVKDAVMRYGSVGASMYWDGNTTSGTGGSLYYNAAASAYFYNGYNREVNHMVLIVGWNDDYSRDNFSAFNRPLNNGAWLVKNSWGSAWGDGGYFWISYEDTSFPIETFAVNGTVPYDSKTTVYEHEYTIASGSGYWLTDTNYYSRIYQLTNDNQILQQVRLFITEANLNVEVDVIPNFTSLRGYIANDFTARGSIISEYPGYYTIDLNQPIALGNSGTKFAVVVKVTGEESRIGYSAAPPNGGTAYRWSPNSDVWEEMNTNYIIKAVTITHEHSFGGWTLFSAATCVEDGQEKRNCSVCGLDETRVSSANKKLDHSFGNWATSVVATCTATGTETRTCSWDSSHKETRTIAAIGHNFGNWAVTSKATERAAGAQTRICANNSAHKETRPIAKLAYTVKNRVKCQYKVTVRANISVPCALSASADIDNSGIAFLPSNTARGYTCSEKLTMSDGSTRYRTGDYYFEYDGKTMSVEVLHSFGGWKTTTNATCKTAGKQNRTCPCGHKETRSVKKKAHSLKTTTTTKATAKKAGKSTTSCTACKTVTKTVAIPKIKSVKLAKTKYTYKGESIKPKVTVTNSNGKALKKGTDYTVTYSKGCKNVGEYTATINFKGKYTGKSQKTFTILPKGTKISSIGTKNGYTLNVKKQSKQTTGYEIQYSTDGNFKKNNKRVTVTKNTKNVAKLKANTYYYIRVRTYKTVKADGKSKKIYSPWSSNGWTKGGNVWRIRSDVGTRMHIVIR